MTLDGDVDVTHLINGYITKKGNVKTCVVPYDSPQDADLIMVIFKFTYNSENEVSYSGYRVEIDIPSDGREKSQEKQEELKRHLLDAANHRNGRYVELETKSKFKVNANFVRRDGNDTEVFYSTGTTNMELSTTSGSSYEEFLNQMSIMSKDYLRQNKETEEMLLEVKRMKEAMEDLIVKSDEFRDESLRAFTATMNQQKAKNVEVIEENEKLRAFIEDAGLEAPARKANSELTSFSPTKNGKAAKGSSLKSSGGRKSTSPKISRIEEDEDDVYNQDTDVSSPDEVRSPSPPSKKQKTATPVRNTRKRKSVDSEEGMRNSPDVIPDSEELPTVKVTTASKDDDDETDYDSQELFKDNSQEVDFDLPVITRSKRAKHVSPFKKSPANGDATP